MTRLILIRHGQTDYNLQNRYCGFSNPPLNNQGIKQSKRLTARVKDIKIDKVYSSDLKRAYQTAEIIFKNNPIEKVADFREVDFGLFEGLKYGELTKIYPKLYRDWINNPIEVKIPNGECLKDLNKRVKKRLSSILSQHENKTLALVTHSGPIRIILYSALNSDLKMFWQIEPKTAALNIIDYPEESSPIVVDMNGVSRLSNQGATIL